MAKFKIVTGLPGSGKSTYVQKNKKNNDLIFDYDSIIHALTNDHFWRKNAAAHDYVIKIMELMISKGKNDRRIGTIWIIRSVPDKGFKEKLWGCRTEYLYLNVSIDVCLNRINSDDKRKKSDINFLNFMMSIEKEGRNGAFECCKWIDND